MAVTLLSNLVNPQVVADIIEGKLVNDIKFSPLAEIDYDLQGRPGNTITLPKWSYIGDASVVAENGAIPIQTLAQTNTTQTVHKLGNGVEITDEAVLSGVGDPVNEAARQLALSIASAFDNEALAALAGISGSMVHNDTNGFSADTVADALEKFGEDIDGRKVLLVSPAEYTVLRKAANWIAGTDVGADLVIRGTVGMIYGCQVVVSNKLDSTSTAYIVKPGALRISMKRDTEVESARDIVHKTTVLTADKHSVVYLYRDSDAIKITF